MMKKLFILPVLALSISFSQGAFSHNMKDPEKNRHQCMHEMMQKLNLTDAQKNKLKTIKEQARENMKKNFEALRAIRQEMRPLVVDEKLNEDKMNALIEKKKEVVASATKEKMMMEREVFNVLDAKQKEHFISSMKQCEEKMSEE